MSLSSLTFFTFVSFSSFWVFGGIIVLLFGVRMMLTGSAALVPLRGGEPSQVAGAIALPFMMGPGTISASVIIGKRLQEPASVFFAVVIAVTLPTISLIVTKVLHDFVQKNKEALLGRYLNITGRVIAMSIGTYAIEMIMSGVDLWLENTNLPTL